MLNFYCCKALENTEVVSFLAILANMENILLYRTKYYCETQIVFGYALRLHHILGACLSKGKYIFKGIQDVGIVQDHNLPIVSSQN